MGAGRPALAGIMRRMLFRQRALEGLRSGAITLAFRRWTRPTVRSGGTLLTPVGELRIASVTAVEPEDITEEEARRAGHPSRAALIDELRAARPGTVYRIAFGGLGPDPREALRTAVDLSSADVAAVRARLEALDGRSPTGPWVQRTLTAIQSQPAVRAGDLCHVVGLDLARFKRQVRALKGLGLTESLEVGYRLSPRGERVLAALASGAPHRGR